ncbi:MAG: hypothetical protein Ta2B_30590 [Termitinemataceae bacterium]|nr:MAG: hypothetical protein Ta2B_30590 [Termitinemataceae bacterium]
MKFSSDEFHLLVKELIKLSVQADTDELENYKKFVDSINPSQNERVQKIKEEEYKNLEQKIQNAISRLNKLMKKT